MQSNIKFIPIDYENFDYEGMNYIRIIGRSEDKKRVCLIDGCDVYFWVILNKGVSDKKIKELSDKINKISVVGKQRESKVLKTEIHNKNFLGKEYKVIKVFISNYKDSKDIVDKIKFKEVFKIREYDLNYITKYIIEKKFKPLKWYEIKGDLLNNSNEYGGVDRIDVDLCLELKGIKEIDKGEFKPKVLAFDIETDKFEIGKGEILMISLYGENFRKVITWKGNSNQDFVEKVKDEEELIERFVSYVKKYNPDILTGYFSDGFDLPYIKARADKLKVELNLGLDDSSPIFRKGALMTGKISGLVHLDIFRFIKIVYSQYMQSETLSLDDVAEELIGERKQVWDFISSDKIDNKKWEEFFSYNLRDSELCYKLFEKIWPDVFEFTKIIEEPLFEVSRYSMSNLVENYIIHNLEKYNEIAEKKPLNDAIKLRKEEGKYEGAFVFQPVAGLYENLVFFDFTSMYGSVIVSFNLSKESYLEKKEINAVEVDVGRKVYFSKNIGFFSKMLNDIIEKRKEYKKEYNENKIPILKARSNAFKLLANSSYGYLGFFGARYYCREAAASTAALARIEIKKTISDIEKNGYKVVYGDTDSIAFLQGKKTKKEVNDMLKEINDNLPGIMKLDLEGFFIRGIWVTKRTGDFGAKKKYALLGEDEKIKIKGFETVRRDWCDLARKTQSKILEFILRDGNEKKALEYLKKIVNNIKKREIEIKELVIRTQLKKSIEGYKSISPHVAVAEKMRKQGIPVGAGSLIEYYIAESNDKKSLIRDKAKILGEKGLYNIEYYLKNQILPAVENILEVFKIDVNELFDGEKQKGLGEF
ncbi:MAG: DNA-directed DNA polymerase [Nanoarchaeota archaeon]